MENQAVNAPAKVTTLMEVMKDTNNILERVKVKASSIKQTLFGPELNDASKLDAQPQMTSIQLEATTAHNSASDIETILDEILEYLA
jgi:hypothetical protein